MRYKNKEPIELDKLIIFLKNTKFTIEPSELFINNKTEMEAELIDIHVDFAEYKVTYITKAKANGKTWYFERNKGWYVPTQKQLINKTNP